LSLNEKSSNTYSSENLYSLAREGKLPHAIMIECADSAQAYETAFKTVANAFCANSDGNEPCGKCGNCIKMSSNSHPDVKTVYPQGNPKSIKIDDIRFMREDAYIASNEGSYKFYVIADADCMTVQAQNALIKILEEPPKNVIFIILCKSSLSLLGTVRSRSQIFKIGHESAGETDTNRKNLAKDIALASLKNDECEVIKLMASIPNDRIFLKNLIDDIIEIFLKLCAQSNDFGKNSESLIKSINDLKYTASLADKNINFNLLTCYLCACL
jgi:hypothetical protein